LLQHVLGQLAEPLDANHLAVGGRKFSMDAAEGLLQPREPVAQLVRLALALQILRRAEAPAVNTLPLAPDVPA
jgi:hypothetical protein